MPNPTVAANSRRTSYADDEEIEVKPSTELIPDEYERETNANILVHMFFSPKDEDAVNFRKTLEGLGFDIQNKINVHHDITKLTDENVWQENIKKIQEEASGKDGLIVVCSKVRLSDHQMTKMWCSFTRLTCPALKDKPKIFMFQMMSSSITADAKMSKITFESAYDTPAEADILIIHETSNYGQPSNFVSQLTENIQDFGNQEDVVSLATYQGGSASKPLLICTMTRKFYFTVNTHRGHHHCLNKKDEEISQCLKEFKSVLSPKSKSKDSKVAPSIDTKQCSTSNATRNRITKSNGRMSTTDGTQLPMRSKLKSVSSTTDGTKTLKMKTAPTTTTAKPRWK
ncbi:uncharacterized protein LOC132698375 [Cylas formicarius]|uniref:uncharacterized protein LOC132698375 n=1 Tax=Cylas formicarius TaxID=197179 RepID=UPI0029589B0E|nr:uncharacterized protein LOC132698375 [Cylas formicarius]